ncbi:glutaredoxin family protein [Vibrio sp. SCSIO 43136]|uniref:glutaredoxin family protein n=1 Tax=Vibrio sp. SCSIO 43136 TaxID=2819101 RepID=UPI00207571CA|nr:glutaredoxin family protein [Vibrio sp. SCSIO 43136]USD66532.1 glutaredoxin family protein [Vibrio sp. SCSIO 43136]
MIQLFSTEGCHLCEMALSLTEQLGIKEQVQVVDIAFDDELFSRYGVTIPVLEYQGNELFWPFDSSQLQQWLTQHGINHHS